MTTRKKVNKECFKKEHVLFRLPSYIVQENTQITSKRQIPLRLLTISTMNRTLFRRTIALLAIFIGVILAKVKNIFIQVMIAGK